MAFYGPTAVARVLSAGHNRHDCTFKRNSAVGTLLRPAAWTRAYAWQPANTCFAEDGRKVDENFMAFCGYEGDSERSNFMESLRLARAGAIHQGVFTSGSLTVDESARADAFVDRWHCRRLAKRSGFILAAVLEHSARSVRARLLAAFLDRWRKNLAPLPRVLLRPKLFLILDIRRRKTLHASLTAWSLLTRQTLAERRLERRRGVRILRLLRRIDRRFKIAGIARWSDATREARDRERRKEIYFERWTLFALLHRHDSTWGVERAMRVFLSIWVKRSAFDHLRAWYTARRAARVFTDVLAAALARDTLACWLGFVVQDRRHRILRAAWATLLRNMGAARHNNGIALTHCRARLLRNSFFVWLEASGRRSALRAIFRRWTRQVALARKRGETAARLGVMLLRFRGPALLRHALLCWRDAVNAPRLVADKADDVVDAPPSAEPVPRAHPHPRSTVCRCVRCLRRYGRLGGRANRPRSGSIRRSAIVVTESRCDVNGHLELLLKSARRTLNKAL